MKTRTGLIVLCAVLVSALVAVAAAPKGISSYFAGAVITPADFADAGDTGLSVSNMYVCLPLAALTNTEYTSALITNDVRGLVAAVLEAVRTTTNEAFTTYSITRDIRYSSGGTNRTVNRTVSEQQVITVTPGFGN